MIQYLFFLLSDPSPRELSFCIRKKLDWININMSSVGDWILNFFYAYQIYKILHQNKIIFSGEPLEELTRKYLVL